MRTSNCNIGITLKTVMIQGQWTTDCPILNLCGTETYDRLEVIPVLIQLIRCHDMLGNYEVYVLDMIGINRIIAAVWIV